MESPKGCPEKSGETIGRENQSLMVLNKVLMVVWIIWPTGSPSGNQALLRSCAPLESPITLRTALRQIFPGNPLDFQLFVRDVWFTPPKSGFNTSDFGGVKQFSRQALGQLWVASPLVF